MMTAKQEMTKPPPSIAYIIGEFPSISETFIYTEILELMRRGITPIIFALTQTAPASPHASSKKLLPLVIYPPDTIFLHKKGWRRYIHPQAINRFLFSAPIQNLPLLWKAKTRFSGHFFLSSWIARECGRLGVTRLHAHFPEPSLVGFLVSLRTGIPFSFTIHSHLTTESRYWLTERIEKSCRVIAVSRDCKERVVALTSKSNQHKISVIPCGLDLSFHQNLINRAGRVGSKPGFPFISIGRLVPQKGFLYLIRAIALARNSCPGITLTIIGDGPLRASLKRLVRKHNLGRIISFLGSLPQNRLFATTILSHAAFALPCVTLPNGNQDGLPVAVLEAMWYGLPVVTTPVGALGETVTKNCGILVPEKNVSSLARAIETLYQLPRRELHKMGRYGKKLVQRNHDASRTGEQLYTLLTQP